MRIALVGNPNSGKTALFNALTGANQKIANYAGVTVERKDGELHLPAGNTIQVTDLPGAYSFNTLSADEEITRMVCMGEFPGEPAPDLLVCVVDASNLRLHMHFVLEILRLKQPVILVLNMMDEAHKQGLVIDKTLFSELIGVPVVETVAIEKHGIAPLIEQLEHEAPTRLPFQLDRRKPSEKQIRALLKQVIETAVTPVRDLDDKIDAWVLNPILSLPILAMLMFFIFQAVFSWAEPLMGIIEAGIESFGGTVTQWLPAGTALHSLVKDGIFGGLGAVLIFLPQILILFFFILVLEESGYLPRAAFLLDRLMFKAGLTGRAFIPLLSSFACAIPSIMATRAISDPRDRLTTILVAPLMTCSARLPVYTLLIAAFIPERSVFTVFNLQGIVLFTLYFVGIASALVVAYVMKKFRQKNHAHALLMELPPYRLPVWRDVFIGLWDRTKIFLRRVGGLILVLTMLLWFLSSFPAAPIGATEPAIYYSLAGQLGRMLAVVFAPLGFGWELSIALVPGLAAREVAVSALGTVYALSGSEDLIAVQLSDIIAKQWSLATALSLLAWYVFAPQCLATLAVIRRETNSWRYMFGAAAYLFGLAYLAAFLTYQISNWVIS